LDIGAAMQDYVYSQPVEEDQEMQGANEETTNSQIINAMEGHNYNDLLGSEDQQMEQEEEFKFNFDT
jgi:hypothetical protein